MYEKHTRTRTYTQTHTNQRSKDKLFNEQTLTMNRVTALANSFHLTLLLMWKLWNKIVSTWKQGGALALQVYFCIYTLIPFVCVCVCERAFFYIVKIFHQSSVLSSSSTSSSPSLKTTHSIQWLRSVAFSHIYIFLNLYVSHSHSLHLKPPKLINCIEVNNTSSFFNGKCSLVASVFFLLPSWANVLPGFFFTLLPLWGNRQ